MLLWIVLLAIISGGIALEDGDEVTIYVNKVGPYFNPHETYHYYELPVCRPKTIEQKSLSLGEVLAGDRMAKSMYTVEFKKSIEDKELCNVAMSPDDLKRLRSAVEQLYYFEFFLDKIPMRGFVGNTEETSILPHNHVTQLFIHHTFTVLYKDDKIIYANVSTREKPAISIDNVQTFPLLVRFTYSVKWIATDVSYEDRHKLLHNSAFFPKSLEIHWLSVINSTVLVILLVGFVGIILGRILKHDFARYNLSEGAEKEEVDELEDDSENGWKIIHGDVFRIPVHRTLFCGILGTGCQFLVLFLGILVMACTGLFNVHNHGTINTAATLLFAFTSSVAGYVAGYMFKLLGGNSWVWNINITWLLFAAPFFVVWSVVNTFAWAHGATTALPLPTVVLLAALWLFVGYPLTVIGGIMGKNHAPAFDPPCRTKAIHREIPLLPWYRSAVVHCLIGGFLPFSSISVELYYIFSTLWGREQYTLFGVLAIIYIIVLMVTACISVTLTYFQLNSEDYRWWWRSLFTGGTTGLFVFVYAWLYFWRRSSMTGDLQTVQFFGYSLLVCYIAFLTLGTVSFFASLKFVRYIYSNVKMD